MAGENHNHRLARLGQGFQQVLFRLGQIEAGAVAAVEARLGDQHLFAFKLTGNAHNRHHYIGVLRRSRGCRINASIDLVPGSGACAEPRCRCGQTPEQYVVLPLLELRVLLELPTLLSDPKGVDFKPYLAQVLASVKRAWYVILPKNGHRGYVSVQFAIQRDGTVRKVAYAQSTGDASLDNTAVMAIGQAGPFGPLPVQYTEAEIHVQMNFAYNQPRQ